MIGNLDARRDWGYAPEYVEAIWKIVQHNEPGDFVIGTGESYSVKDFVSEAFKAVGLNWKDYVEIDPRYYRPSEVDCLIADPTKAKEILGWEAQTKFKDLVGIMLEHELKKFGVADKIKYKT